jgi:hypothetical protein
MKINNKLLSVVILIILSSCVQIGWRGNYVQKEPVKYRDNKEEGNIKINFSKDEVLYLKLPKDNTNITLNGFMFPIFPIIYYPRMPGFDHDFSVFVSEDSQVSLKSNNQIYQSVFDSSKKTYTFPAKSRSIKDGVLVIEKDQSKIEIPFEYNAKFGLEIY